MGHVYIDATLKGPRGSVKIKKVPVDTGATFTVAERSILEKIGAPMIAKRMRVELGDGRKVFGSVYGILIRIRDREGPTLALTFKDAKRVIGSESLEALCLTVNPKKRRLEGTRAKGLVYFY